MPQFSWYVGFSSFSWKHGSKLLCSKCDKLMRQESAQGAVNETSEAAGNETQGLGGAVNETGEALSNATGGIFKDLKTYLMAQALR